MIENNSVKTDDQSIPTLPSPVSFSLPVTVFKKQNFILENEDLNQIVPLLFLGSLEAAKNVELLKKLNITHVLTVEDHPLEPEIHKNFVEYKFKQIYDHPYSNILDILEECVSFIENALKQNTGVLVHCLAGVSRSASIVTAYIMKNEKKTLKEALEFVKLNRQIRPNMGFHKQLQFYEAMDFQIVKDSPTYRMFKLERIANHIKNGARFEEVYIETDLFNTNDDNVSCYKCKKCRFKLFNANQTLSHLKNDDSNEENVDWKSKLNYYKDLKNKMQEKNNQCNSEIHVEPLCWFQDKLSDINGKINCPKCDAKLGSFDWCGSKCMCGTWITPSFHISLSKVDFCPVYISPVKNETPASKPELIN